MQPLSVTELARICDAEVSAGAPDTMVGPDVVIDSRDATVGSLFVALPGERVDGHDFVAAAAAGGTVAAIVQHPVSASVAQLVVKDQVAALAALGTAVVADARAAGLRVVAITGSSGKTTTKDMTAQLLEPSGDTVAPVGSFNNEIGLPLTATRCTPQTRFMVSEMGAQRRGEITMLCGVTPPDVGIVLNVGRAHVGEFGGVEAIVEAKRELVEALPVDGLAVLNRDDQRVWGMRTSTAATVVAASTAGEPSEEAAVWASHIVTGTQQQDFVLHHRGIVGSGEVRVSLPLAGRHMVHNALSAAAAALWCRVAPEQIAERLAGLQQRSRWRLALTELPAGWLLVNDAYNANPESVAASLDTVTLLWEQRRQKQPQARLIAVLGDMLELGDESADAHREVGRRAAHASVVMGVGGFAEHVVAGAGHGTALLSASEAEAWLREHVRPGDIVLLKGSKVTGLGPLGDRLSTEQGES